MKKTLQKLAAMPTAASIIVLVLSGLVFTVTIWTLHIGLLLAAESGHGLNSSLFFKQIKGQVTYFHVDAPNTYQADETIAKPFAPPATINGGRVPTAKEIEILKQQYDKQNAQLTDPAEIETKAKVIASTAKEPVFGGELRAGCYDTADKFHHVEFNYGEWTTPPYCNPKKVFAYYIEIDAFKEFPLSAALGLIITGLFLAGSTRLASAVTMSLSKVKNSKKK